MTYDISKMETTQTAVQWLALRYHHRQGYLSQEDIAEAKQMEKEQIIDAYKHGQNNGYMYKDVGNDIINAEQYYNETYGGKEL